jgi:hypothetical protein
VSAERKVRQTSHLVESREGVVLSRLIGPLFAITFVLPAAVAAPRLPDHQSAPGLYFPTRVGAKWVYQNGLAEYAEVVTEVEREEKTLIVTTAIVDNQGDPRSNVKVAVSTDGLFLVDNPRLGEKPKSPACLLSLKHRPGDEWTDSLYGYAHTASEPEWIDVPAGRFKAIRVEQKVIHSVQRRKNTYWYAEGVGLVKWESSSILRPTVLKSFDPGKE